jgi:HEPN domain-containing protein
MMVGVLTSLGLVLPKRIEERLEEESRRTGASEEELIVEALLKAFGERLDQGAKVEFHLKLSEKYMMEAEELLKKGDLAQASEKAWGASSQIVKALAAREGRELRSHGELHKQVAKIARETKDEEIRSLWQSAGMLHQNFYENWLPPEMVEGNVKDVKKFVEKLRQLLK